MEPHVQSESTDMEFICKSYLGEVWLTSHHTEATSSLFARMLLVARSSREDIDLQQVIGTHEFSHINEMLMPPDGPVHPTRQKHYYLPSGWSCSN